MRLLFFDQKTHFFQNFNSRFETAQQKRFRNKMQKCHSIGIIRINMLLLRNWITNNIKNYVDISLER